VFQTSAEHIRMVTIYVNWGTLTTEKYFPFGELKIFGLYTSLALMPIYIKTLIK
jgi:hypothetical protein